MSEQFKQEAIKNITNNYKFVSTFVVCFISCATALFHYANQLMLMGYLEFFGYSLDIVKSNVFEILGIVFEVVKLCAFVVIVQRSSRYADGQAASSDGTVLRDRQGCVPENRKRCRGYGI